MLISSRWAFRVMFPAPRIGRVENAVSGWVACECDVDPAVSLPTLSAALESNMLSPSGRLRGSSLTGSRRESDEGMGSWEIVARDVEGFLLCNRTGPPFWSSETSEVCQSWAWCFGPGRGEKYEVPSTPT